MTSVRRHGPTVVVGAGPHALTIAVRLLTDGLSRRDELVVLDPAGRWLASWRAAFDALGIEHLRSPVVHHPHPDPYALLNFARDRRRGTELHGRYQAPSTRLFDDFCDHVIAGHHLDDAVIAARATAVEPDGTVTWTPVGDGSSGGEERYRAGRIVIAANPMVPVRPGELFDAPPGWTPTPVHAGQIDSRAVDPGEHVVVVGGGLTAGHLVCAAVSRGARVTLVSRRAIVEREFDTDPGWLGPRHLHRYLATECLATRARLAGEARGGGSMPGWMLRRLVGLERNGRLTRCVMPTSGGRPLGETIAHLGADHLWCATGWTLSTRDDPLIGPLLRTVGTETVGELPVLGPRLDVLGTEQPVHLVGRPATLLLGPTAGNLAGARRAADLIAGRDPDAIA